MHKAKHVVVNNVSQCITLSALIKCNFGRRCISGSVPSDECQSITTPCLLAPCPTTPPQTFIPEPVVPRVYWGQWQAWSDCSTSCSLGIQTRTRYCFRNNILTNSRRCLNAYRSEKEQETKNCNQEMCRVWTTWSSYSECDKTCGNEAIRRSTRTCVGVPEVFPLSEAFGRCRERLLLCQSLSCDNIFTVSASRTITTAFFRTTTEATTVPLTTAKSTTSPTTSPPTTFGSWQNWLPWSACSQTCNQGRRNRLRKCSLKYVGYLVIRVKGERRCKGF